MTTLWIGGEWATIRTYSATANAKKASVKIEIEVHDIEHLGFLLSEIGRAKKEGQLERAKPHEKARPLMIPYMPADEG